MERPDGSLTQAWSTQTGIWSSISISVRRAVLVNSRENRSYRLLKRKRQRQTGQSDSFLPESIKSNPTMALRLSHEGEGCSLECQGVKHERSKDRVEERGIPFSYSGNLENLSCWDNSENHSKNLEWPIIRLIASDRSPWVSRSFRVELLKRTKRKLPKIPPFLTGAITRIEICHIWKSILKERRTGFRRFKTSFESPRKPLDPRIEIDQGILW